MYRRHKRIQNNNVSMDFLGTASTALPGESPWRRSVACSPTTCSPRPLRWRRRRPQPLTGASPCSSRAPGSGSSHVPSHRIRAAKAAGAGVAAHLLSLPAGMGGAPLRDGAAVAQRCGGQQGGAGLGRGERRRRGGAHGSGSGVRPSAVAFWRVRVAGCFF